MGEKLYKTAGTSVSQGVKKLRLANNSAADRYKVLHKNGHEEIRLFDLPHEMTAAQAEEWLKQQGDVVPDHTPKDPAPKAAGRPKPDKTAKTAITVNRTVARKGKDKEGEKKIDFWGTDWSALDREVSEEVDELAKKLQKSDYLSFMPWDVIGAATRNEYRMKAERELAAAAREQGEPV